MAFAQVAEEEAVAILLSILRKQEKPAGSPESSQGSTSDTQTHLSFFALVKASENFKALKTTFIAGL